MMLKNILLSILIGTIGIFIWLYIFEGLSLSMTTSLSNLSFGTSEWPYSLDPLEFDAGAHHFAFKSVHFSLLSLHRNNGPIGMLAESWTASGDKKTWTFKIRKNLTFENGDPITPESIRISLTRIFYKILQNKSKHDVINNLKQVDKITTPLSTFDGLKNTDSEIIFTLNLPVKNFLENISFGLFGVTHQSQWDPKTGDWINSKQTIASGSYKVEKWDDNHLKLQIRPENRLAHFHENVFKTILIEKTDGSFRNHDVYEGSEMNEYDKSTHQFEQGGQVLISFLKSTSWSNPTSPFYFKEDRIRFRDLFYIEFQKNLRIEPYFFSHILGNQRPSESIRFIDPSLPYQWKGSRTINVYFRYRGYLFEPALIASLKKVASNLGLTLIFKENALKDLVKDLSQDLPKYNLDLVNVNTTLLAENPLDDVKFMYFSQEGIRLPDQNSLAEKELKRDFPDFKALDNALLDHAVIWAYKHHSLGYFFKDKVDISLVNPNIPPFEFAFIGQK